MKGLERPRLTAGAYFSDLQEHIAVFRGQLRLEPMPHPIECPDIGPICDAVLRQPAHRPPQGHFAYGALIRHLEASPILLEGSDGQRTMRQHMGRSVRFVFTDTFSVFGSFQHLTHR